METLRAQGVQVFVDGVPIQALPADGRAFAVAREFTFVGRTRKATLREDNRSHPRGQHFDADPLATKAERVEPLDRWPRWSRGELEHAEQRRRGRGQRRS